jgi:hypothetical protein
VKEEDENIAKKKEKSQNCRREEEKNVFSYRLVVLFG